MIKRVKDFYGTGDLESATKWYNFVQGNIDNMREKCRRHRTGRVLDFKTGEEIGPKAIKKLEKAA